jgi:Ca2+-binding RTX toxin-like protein
MYESSSLRVVGAENGLLVLIGRWVAGPAVVIPNAYANVLLSAADALGGPRLVPAVGFDGEIEIDARFLDLASKLVTAMTLTGLAAGVAVSLPLALTLTAAAIAAGALSDPEIRDKITDPDFWHDVGQFLFPDKRDLNDLLVPDPSISNNWRTATTPPRRDPLAIDLDGDGIETVGIPATGSPVLFDHDGDGVQTGTGWVKADDAWLVLDRNGNGTIDTGAELFGVDTMITVTEVPFGGSVAETVTRRAKTGFEALATLDTNHDGVFNASDAAFTQVRLWQDLNQDGTSQSGELFTLADKGITAIGLTPSTTTTNLGNGNSVTGQASVTRSNGTSTQIDSVDLQAGNLTLADNPFYREFTDTIPLSAQAQTLPEMGGSGWLRDLREAMSLGTTKAATLTQLVSNFAATTTRDGQRAQLDGLIDAWARTTGRVDTAGSRGLVGTIVSTTATSQTVRYTTAEPVEGQSTATGLSAVEMSLPPGYYEEVLGHGWVGGAYVSMMVKQLTAEGQEIFRRMGELEVFNAQRFVGFTQTAEFDPNGNIGPVSGSGGGGGGGGTAPTTPPTSWARLTLAQQQVDSLNAAYDALRESMYQALVTQTRLRPYLDVIDLVIDGSGIRFDTTALAAKLAANRTTDERNALLDLVDLNRYATSTLRAVGYDGMITLRGWIDALPAGSALRAELPTLDVLAASATNGSGRPDIYLGDAGANTFNAGNGNDIVDGGGGSDTLHGASGDDVLLGRDGDDYLYGEDGNDTFDGGSGNDYVSGDAGNDTYLFGKGDGQDTIGIEYVTEAGKLNVLQFKAGVAPSEVQVTRSNQDLVLSIAGTTDKITVGGFFRDDDPSNSYNPIQQVKFNDGSSWNIATIMTMAITGNDTAQTLTGYGTADVINAAGGDDYVFGHLGDDTLDGGAGSDTLHGNEGNDILKGGTDNDYLYGEEGNDTLDGGIGNDYLDGAAGNDTYLFGKGDGQDTIGIEYVAEAGKLNVLQFKAGVAPSEVQVTRSNQDLVLSIAGTTDKITVGGFFRDDDPSNAYNPVQQIRFNDGSSWNIAAIMDKAMVGDDTAQTLTGYGTADVINAMGGDDYVYGHLGNDTLDGGAGSDTLHGNEGSDILKGGTDNDYLYGEEGNDTLDGGIGNDYLDGAAGNDTYLFGKGDGQDTIGIEYVAEAGKLNVLQFKAGVAPSEVQVTRSNQDLVLSIAGTTDKITVGGFFRDDDPSNAYNPVQQIRFNDGSSWSIATIMTMAIAGNDTAQTLTGYGTADVINAAGGDDYVYGHMGNDTLDGGAGSDTLHGNEGNDTLKGGADNDYLYGEDGNDTLDGGAGNDYLDGAAGNDTYLFGRGDGQDTIGIEYVAEAGKLNVLQFKAGVAPSEVQVTRSNQDLVLSIAGTTDKITVGGFFRDDDPANSYNPVQQIKFNDGSSWSIATIMAKAIVGNDTAQTLIGYGTADVINAAGGDDYVYGHLGDDTLDGGAGSDTLHGNEGNDTLKGGADNDYLYGEDGNDTLDGGAGNDFLDGAAGNDTYLFGKGDGQDTIGIEYVTEAGKLNVLQFKAGVAPSEIVVTRSSVDLVLSIAGTTDKITIGNFFRDDDPANSYNPVQQIKFNDGSSWNIATIMAKAIVGNDTAQTLIGYGTADVINAAGGDDYVYGHFGDDTLDGGAGADTLHGNEGNDTLKGGADNDYLYGEDGNDTLDGGAGTDTLDGGMGNDTYVVDVATDTVIEYAAAGTDLVQASVTYTLAANIENLTLTGTTVINATGNTLDNILIGNSANNTLTGGAGNDTLDGGAGNDAMLGGAGDDIYVVNVTTDVVTESAGEGTDRVQSSVTWTLGANLENLTLTGTAAINGTGNTLDNALTGNSANNTLTGGAGNDTLDGGLGNDTMVGGTGNDTFVVNVATDVVTENAGEGTDTVQSAVAWTLSANLENLTLTGTAAINGTGNANANTLVGNGAANTLTGAEGNDLYDGGAGNDTLSDASTTSSDTYRWGLGMGSDTLTDKGGTLDHVDLFAGVTKSQLKFTKNANNLELTITGASDKLVVTNWYLGAANQIEEFRLADGSKVLASEVQGLLSAMAVFSVPASSPGIVAEQVRTLPVIWRGADLAVAA